MRMAEGRLVEDSLNREECRVLPGRRLLRATWGGTSERLPRRREGRERERVRAGVDPPDVAIWCSFQHITCCWPVLGLDIHGFLERLQMRVS